MKIKDFFYKLRRKNFDEEFTNSKRPIKIFSNAEFMEKSNNL